MPRLSTTDQIEAYRRQQVELAKKIKEAEGKARDRQKLDDQRRESLAGRCLLDLAVQNPDSPLIKTFFAALSQRLTRPTDRALFPALKDLPLPDRAGPAAKDLAAEEEA